MRCEGCGLENRTAARFCRGCGAVLPHPCEACGAVLPPGAGFCDHCGARVASPAAPGASPRSPRPAMHGERKLVTVLFADVVDSTGIAASLDPEEMRTLLDRCFGHMVDEVHRYEGTVNQFTGDGVMALFGAPVALEDAPRRAVESALAIQAALARCRAELRETCKVELQVRIGIHTGLVVFGRIGNDQRDEVTAIGDAANVAARLQALAPPGGVVVSEATHRLVAPYVTVRDLGSHVVRGRSEAIRVYEVLDVSGARGRVEALAVAGLTPLAGRGRELGVLRQALRAVSERRQGQVVFLVGEAGIGKSRLLHEFHAQCADIPHRWLEGRCASYGMATAFLPLVDLMRRVLAIDDRDRESEVLEKVAQGVGALGDDLAPTLPLLRQFLSLPSGDAAIDALDAVTRRAETAQALKALVLRAAEREPVVLVIEDLHWIDPASEEFLGFLFDSIASTPVLVVLTHRPGYRHPFGDRSFHHRITVDALDGEGMATMAAAILDVATLPADVREVILSKAEGNPLFVEEVTKSLLEDGSLERRDGAVRLARRLAEVAVPDSIHGVLMARLDRLADEPKQALQMASVIGREFALRLLERVTTAGAAVSGLVGELRALELICEKAAYPELAFMFKHALTHDVAYESILLQRRRELHRTIGLAVEELYADRLGEHLETLALHFTRGEDWPRAFAYHRRAAEKALAAYANHGAIAHCREALAVANRLGDAVSVAERRGLEEMLGAALMWVSEFNASGDAFARAAALADDPTARTAALGLSGFSYTWGHSYELSERMLRDAAAIASTECVGAAAALLSAVEGFGLAVLRGDLPAFARLTAEAIEVAARSGDEVILGLAQFMRGEVLEWQGELAAALPFLEQALAVGNRTGHPFLRVIPTWIIGKTACGLGDYRRALVALRDSEALCAQIGNRAWQSRLLNTIGWCLAEVGAHAAAEPYNRRAAALAHEIGDPEILANSEINLARNRLAAGDAEGAQALLAPFTAALERPGDPWMRWRYALHLHDALGRVALCTQAPERSLAHADQQLAGARDHGLQRIEARALELRAAALMRLDRREAARLALREALTVAARIHYLPTQWRAHDGLAELARRDGDAAAAAAQAAQSRRLVDGLVRDLPGELALALRTAHAGRGVALQ